MKRAAIVFLLILSGCGGARRPPAALVMPQGGGEYSVTGYGFSEPDAVRQAVDAAAATCGQGRTPAVEVREQRYDGSGERIGSAVETVRRIAVPVRWMIPSAKSGDDYKAILAFRCE